MNMHCPGNATNNPPTHPFICSVIGWNKPLLLISWNSDAQLCPSHFLCSPFTEIALCTSTGWFQYKHTEQTELTVIIHSAFTTSNTLITALIAQRHSWTISPHVSVTCGHALIFIRPPLPLYCS